MATALSNFAFTSSRSGFVCPTFYSNWLCPPPNACAHDINAGRIYCCGQSDNDLCWTISIGCANDGSTLGCSNAGQTWCCVNGIESCINATGRYNVCLSKASDVLFGLSADALNATYSSLASASPSASSYTFDPAKLGATMASSVSTTSTGTTASTAQSTTDSQSTGRVATGLHTSLSGGAIGGIVAGVVVALLIALGAIYLILKCNRSKRAPPQHGAPQYGTPPPGPMYAVPSADRTSEAQGKPIHESRYTERAYEVPPADRTEAQGKPIYETGYTERAYEMGGPDKQVHEAGGLASSRYELSGR